jgi:hypothetical protein
MKKNFNINDIVKHLSKIYQLNDENTYLIDIVLAVAVSVVLDPPVWIMIVAPASSGKTEFLNLISRIRNYHRISTLTRKFLFSAHQVAGGGYMSREVGEIGILAFPDFTTVLSKSSFDRKEIFNQLRVIYDGEAGLGSGIDTEGLNSWKGKVAVIACVTQSIEKYKNHSNDLGERFLYFNHRAQAANIPSIPSTDNEKLDDSFFNDISTFVESARYKVKALKIEVNTQNWLWLVAQTIAQARTSVDRNSYSRDIEFVHQPEQPYRLYNALNSLYRCLLSVNENESRVQDIIRIVARSSIPVNRLKIIELYKADTKVLSLDQIVRKHKISSTVIRRTCEDLVALNILTADEADLSQPIHYSLVKDFSEKWNKMLK